MRTACLAVLLLALTSCACVSKPKNPSDPVYQVTGVTITYYADLGDRYPRFDVFVKFRNNTDYTHLVQELEMEHGWWLVETFRVAKGHSVVDHHAGTGWRRMRVYPANVLGALEHNGFAHLARNQDGSIVTKIPPGFNVAYREVAGDGPWPGVIVKQAPEMTSTWRITPDREWRQVEVWTGSGITLLRAP